MRHTLRALALLSAIAIPSVGAGPDYRHKQRQEQVKALAKKQRVREQIRARRAVIKGVGK